MLAYYSTGAGEESSDRLAGHRFGLIGTRIIDNNKFPILNGISLTCERQQHLAKAEGTVMRADADGSFDPVRIHYSASTGVLAEILPFNSVQAGVIRLESFARSARNGAVAYQLAGMAPSAICSACLASV